MITLHDAQTFHTKCSRLIFSNEIRWHQSCYRMGSSIVRYNDRKMCCDSALVFHYATTWKSSKSTKTPLAWIENATIFKKKTPRKMKITLRAPGSKFT
uniref:Uncharacterized protein n=1 Tax=Romanomermis culicivorax TaxID=13658 RepID=A0A915K888_ROMCU